MLDASTKYPPPPYLAWSEQGNLRYQDNQYITGYSPKSILATESSDVHLSIYLGTTAFCLLYFVYMSTSRKK